MRFFRLAMACLAVVASCTGAVGDDADLQPADADGDGDGDGDGDSDADADADADTDADADVAADADVDVDVDPDADACARDCEARECGGDRCGGSCGECGEGASCDESGRCVPVIPPDCPLAAEVVVYTQSAWNVLADELRDEGAPCASFWISMPATGTPKTQPRAGGEPEDMRARGAAFHALAEFHWTSWNGVDGMTWYEKGVEFRRLMDAAGYDVTAGDAWAINELPSSVRSDDAVRTRVRNAVRGLYEGPAGSPPVQGVVFTVGMGQGTTNFDVYKPNMRDWLQDDAFWDDMALYVRFWAQEVYADPDSVCVGSAVTGDRSGHINAYTEHPATLAAAGPAAAAEAYFDWAYTPLMNAVWRSEDSGYGNTMITLEQMQHHVSTEVYAARAWSSSHDVPDGRLGFAWARTDGTVDADLTVLAQRLASAIHYAYDEGGGAAAGACSPSGAYTWCQCDVAGAAFNEGWDTFTTW
jgi:hypothetical protein